MIYMGISHLMPRRAAITLQTYCIIFGGGEQSESLFAVIFVLKNRKEDEYGYCKEIKIRKLEVSGIQPHGKDSAARRFCQGKETL